MKIKKDWFGMFSSTREYARSIYVREPTEEVEKRIWTKRIKTAGVLMAALLLSFLYCLFHYYCLKMYIQLVSDLVHM